MRRSLIALSAFFLITNSKKGARITMREYRLFIDGEFVESDSGEWIEVINPSTEETISRVPEGSIQDVRRAILSSHNAQKRWAKLSSAERGSYLKRIAEEIRREGEKLALTISEEQGKPLSLSRIEVGATAEYFDFSAGWARRYEGEIIPSDRKGENILLYKAPIGVISAIMPWNFPFFLIARKVSPALITGNTIIVKPSSETPNSAFEFAEILQRVGLPQGVINVVTGRGSVVGEELASNPKIGMVSLTGSVEAGISVMKSASKNITKVSLELGGKAPAIVMKDADLGLAVECIKRSRVINAGQVCNCTERVYVHEEIAEAFTQKMLSAMSSTTYGDPIEDPEVDMGPMINLQALESVDSIVGRAVGEGANLVLGGRRSSRFEKGFFYEPTVLTECRQKMEIVQKEIFGPVLPIVKFRTLEESIEMANDCEYGLTSSVYTKDLNTAFRFCNELKFGETYINRENFEAIQGFHAGWRKSGIGGDDGKHGLEEFLKTHIVYIQYE